MSTTAPRETYQDKAVNRCERCHGNSWIIVSDPYPDDPRYRAIAQRCPVCWSKAGPQRSAVSMGLQKAYERSTVYSLHVDSQPELATAIRHCENYMERWPNVSNKGLVFVGPPGTGKTHLMASVLRGIAAKGGNVWFQDFDELLEQFHDRTREAQADKRSGPVMTSPILGLDDLRGFPGARGEARRELADRVLNHRLNEGLLTLITTNHSLQTLDEINKEREDLLQSGQSNPNRTPSLVECFGDPALSRVMALTNPVSLSAVRDYRKLRPNTKRKAQPRDDA